MARNRIFLAIDLSAAIRGQLSMLRDVLSAGGSTVKWEDSANYHITLLFLGDLNDRELVDVCRHSSHAVKKISPFRISVAGLGAFPTPRRPKILWAGIGEGRVSIQEVFAALEEKLAEIGLYRKEERLYAPHVTLGRINETVAAESLAVELPRHAGWVAGTQDVEEVLIMRSDPMRYGSTYSVVGRASLRGRRQLEEDDAV